ncbi:diguanylate cyclase [Candidatus Fermentibacteria bacterium]|nr:diguanylate cyclase [Candidatus Fermentibacteria bacterium]
MDDLDSSFRERLDRAYEELGRLRRENQRLRAKLSRMELVFRNSVDLLVMVDPLSGSIVRVSDAAEAVLGYRRGRLVGRDLDELLPTEEESRSVSGSKKPPEIMDGIFVDQTVRCADGSTIEMDMTTSLVSGKGGSAILITLRDTTERKRYQREMKRKNSALDAALSPMLVADQGWNLLYSNRRANDSWRFVGEPQEDLEVRSMLWRQEDFENLRRSVESTGSWEGEVACRRLDGTWFFSQATATVVDEGSGSEEERSYVLSFLDISRRVELESRLRELSLRDSMTGLYNRRGFMTIARQLIESSRRREAGVGLLFIDLDGLKRINDEFGHSVGDVAITKTAEVLRSAFRDSDVLARMGGDEFVVLFMDPSDLSERELRRRLEGQLKKLEVSGDVPFDLCMSCGYSSSVIGEDTGLSDLLRRADDRMYVDKQRRREWGESSVGESSG